MYSIVVRSHNWLEGLLTLITWPRQREEERRGQDEGKQIALTDSTRKEGSPGNQSVCLWCHYPFEKLNGQENGLSLRKTQLTVTWTISNKAQSQQSVRQCKEFQIHHYLGNILSWKRINLFKVTCETITSITHSHLLKLIRAYLCIMLEPISPTWHKIWWKQHTQPVHYSAVLFTFLLHWRHLPTLTDGAGVRVTQSVRVGPGLRPSRQVTLHWEP